MFKNNIIRWGTIGLIAVILVYVFVDTLKKEEINDSITPEEFADRILHEREEKEEFFRTSPDSPVKDQPDFHGLHYFAPALGFRVKASIRPFDGNDKEFKVNYTDGSVDSYERYGYADFELEGEKATLLLLKHDGAISLLFKDATSGKETYGGGRYIDFKLSDIKANTLVIDFNSAYNPYCAYLPDYACPMPPAENTLKISIRAGEKYEMEK